MTARIIYHNLRGGGGKSYHCLAGKSAVAFCLAAFLLFTVFPTSVSAQDTDNQSSKNTEIIADDAAAPVMAQESASGAVADKTSTRIETNSENGEIRFYIKDKLAAILNEDGLHVRESTSYGGTLTDYGQKGFDDLADDRAPGKDEADAD